MTHVLVKKLQLALSQKWVRKAGVAAASLRRLLERPGPPWAALVLGEGDSGGAERASMIVVICCGTGSREGTSFSPP